MKKIELRDSTYYDKVKEIALWYYTKNPDAIEPKKAIKFGNERNIASTIRYIIDKEFKRMMTESNHI